MDEPITFTANPAARRLGKRIRARRAELGLTQTALANASQIGQGTISRLERGEMMPSLATLVKLRGALGLTDDQFAEWIEVAA